MKTDFTPLIALIVIFTTFYFYQEAISSIQAHGPGLVEYNVASLVDVCQVRRCV
jgi:hypothetical protein